MIGIQETITGRCAQAWRKAMCCTKEAVLWVAAWHMAMKKNIKIVSAAGRNPLFWYYFSVCPASLLLLWQPGICCYSNGKRPLTQQKAGEMLIKQPLFVRKKQSSVLQKANFESVIGSVLQCKKQCFTCDECFAKSLINDNYLIFK